MNRVRLLPDHVANQIAAGEVVERPASVVKELVENSLDAGATRVSVEIQAGGRSLVRVSDDGVGMSRDDALLCLERHATSKIQKAEDLAAIRTMGFRGEALPSIASVSRFTLTTRERDSEQPEGTQIIISGGKMAEVKAAGCAPGTTIEVRQLFFNLPARRKFLRSEDTESAHIHHYLTLAALAYPQVAFTFLKDERPVWQLAGVKTGSDEASQLTSLRERLRALYGDEQKLLTVSLAGQIRNFDSYADQNSPDDDRLRLWGFIGAPGVSRSTREDQHLFVNRRPVENRGLNFALLEGYHTALMKGRYPVCCLFLELPPDEVDVNIHPAKREVKFHREMAIRRFVAEGVRQALHQFAQPTLPVAAPSSASLPTAVPAQPLIPQSPAPAQHQPVLPSFPSALAPVPEPVKVPVNQPALSMGFAAPPTERAPEVSPSTEPEQPGEPESKPGSPGTASAAETVSAEVKPAPAVAAPGAPIPLLNVPLRMIGVIGRLYVLFESDRGLVLLDQHAAHERILFEQMLQRLETQTQADSQKLLLPETVELSARDAQFLREQLAVLTRLGVGLGEFGDRTFLLDALPPFVKCGNPRKYVLELVDELKAAGQQVNTLRLGEHVVAKTVCRHAVKANDPLGTAELENLVEDLRTCAMPYTCPHGRPTIIEMSFRELEKKFGRAQ